MHPLSASLVRNNMTGTLPSEIGHLEDINLLLIENQTGLHGVLPSTIGNMTMLSSISILFMGPNFGGLIPQSMFAMPSLTHLNINFNEGTWAFPSEIQLGEESSLETIAAESTKLSGLLPTFLFTSDAHKLKVINLRGTSLQGPIPDTIGSIRSLEYLSLHENQLNGTLPPSIGGLTNTTVIALGKNVFEGSIPASFGNLDKLQVLDLSHNRLEGPIPDTFSQLSSLEHVSLQGNANLNGSISAFESLDRLSSLMLYGNSFSGVLPEGLFSEYTGEIWADLGHNNFTGKMPESFSQFAANTSEQTWLFSSLETIYLSCPPPCFSCCLPFLFCTSLSFHHAERIR